MNSEATEQTEVQKALAVIKADMDAREKACMEEIAEVLKRHGCDIQVVPHIVVNGQPAGVLIKASPPTPAM